MTDNNIRSLKNILDDGMALTKWLEKVDSKKLVLVGNGLEFFDLYLYIHLAHVINQKFFPYGEPSALRMLPFISFYLLAPLSSLFFAYIGDTQGRKRVLVTTASIMAISSFLIVLLPTYESWGVYPGYILCLLRVFQGISLGAEPTAVNLYVTESCKNERTMPAWLTLATCTECVGGMLALGLAYIGEHYLADVYWGWRLPFIGGIAFIVFSFCLRFYLAESPEYMTKAYDQPICLTDRIAVSNFYRSLPFNNRNSVCLCLLWGVYPIIFVLAYTYFTPMALTACGLDVNQNIIGHNLLLSLLEITVSLAWVPLALWSPFSVRQITAVRFMLCVVFSFAFYYVLQHTPSQLPLLFLQALIIGCADFVLLAPYLFKTFSVIGRFSWMTITRSIAQLVNFVIIAFVLDLLNQHLGLMGILLCMIIPVITLGLIALYYCVLNYELEERAIERIIGKSKPVKSEAPLMTPEEAREYVMNRER